MDRREVPNHSPVHSHNFFDGSPGHPNPVLRSPPLSHDRPFGMHPIPSAFSVMGRRPGLHSGADYPSSLAHDPLLASQSNLTSPSPLHGAMGGNSGGPGWWMSPHTPHSRSVSVTTPEYFTSPMSGWMGHEHDHRHSSHELHDGSRGSLLNGVSSSSVFAPGSSIFYPSASPPPMHSFVHHTSPSSANSMNWSNHGNRIRSSSRDFHESLESDIGAPSHLLTTCSDDSGSEKDVDARKGKEHLATSQHRERQNSEIEREKIHMQDRTKILGDQSRRDLLATESLKKPQKSKLNDDGPVNSQKQSISSQNKAEAKTTLPPPPKLHKTKTRPPPPPKLEVPKSILNEREGIIPKKPDPAELSSAFTIPMSGIKSVLGQSATSVMSRLNAEIPKPTQEQTKPLKSTTGKSKVKSTTKTNLPVSSSLPKIAGFQKPTVQISPGQQVSSGKPQIIARFRGVTYNEESSDEESSSSDVSSDSDSGSGSDDESEGEEDEEEGEEDEDEEGEGGEEESSISGSDTDSDGSDDDGNDDEENEENNSLFLAQTNDLSFSDGTSSVKRKTDEPAAGRQRKRRRIADEDSVKIPLAMGWRRQTRLRPVGACGGLRGDVYYFAPCGKKLRTYPEVSRYFVKNNITNLTLDNFSFSTKLHVGEFLECKQGTTFEVLSEDEVKRRKEAAEEKKKVKVEKFNKKKEKKKQQAEMARKAQEAKLHRKMERQAAVEAAKQAKKERAEARLRKKIERQQIIQTAKQTKKERAHMLAEQKRMAKERAKEQRQYDKLQRQEQIRLEKEQRAQQVMESRRRKKEDLANAKYEEAMKKAKERELKRQQSLLLKQQEKDKKKQTQQMIRAIESQRKAEERERQKEEKRMEKRRAKERKMEQKRREMILARELKKPVEDMVLRDTKPLPELPRVRNIKVPGCAFADLLMVQEFVYNFGEALDIDPASEMPSLKDMQASLLNESSDNVLVPLCQSLLSAALLDPGVDGPQAYTSLGVHLSKADLNESSLSEILRLFIWARNAEPHELSDALTELPFQALSPVQKGQVMAFLCNELLCSRTVCGEIEGSIEHMSNLRRDKWIIEGRIRKLKAIQSEKYPVVKVKKQPGRPRLDASSNAEGDNSNVASSPMAGSTAGNDDDDDEEEDEEEENDDDDEEDEDSEGGGGASGSSDESDDDDDDTEPTTQEELERKLKKLEKKHSSFRAKLFASSHSLRALSLGQDRFKRRHWILPHAGGVYIEGLESGEKEIVPDVKKEEGQDSCVDVKMDIDNGSAPVKFEDVEMKEVVTNGDLHSERTTLNKTEKEEIPMKSPLRSPMARPPPLKSPPQIPPLQNSQGRGYSMGDTYSRVEHRESSTVIHSNLNSNTPGVSLRDELGSPSVNSSKDTNCFMKSPNKLNNMTAGGSRESTSLFTRIDNLVGASSSKAQAVATSVFVKQKTASSLSKCWFSVIPRMPCDESSLTLSHTPHSGRFAPTYSKKDHSIDFMNSQAITRPPGRPPKTSNPTLNHELLTALGSGTPLAALQGQSLLVGGTNKIVSLTVPSSVSTTSPEKTVAMATSACSTADPTTNSLSFEELKKQVLESLRQEPAPIPTDMQFGWWRITEPSTLKELTKVLHSRGIREKMLQKNLLKYTEYANSSCKKELDDSDDSDEDSDDERSLAASKQKRKQSWEAQAKGLFEDSMFPEVAFAINKGMLREVEDLEERVFTASLQVKGWKLHPKASRFMSYNQLGECKDFEEGNPLSAAITRLASVERGIERRYLKPPLRQEKLQIPTNIGTASAPGEVPSHSDAAVQQQPDSVTDQLVTPALRGWREAVASAKSAAEISLCLSRLVNCIAWEKSIMKVFCQICRKGDNEELLLLCDGCDRGYHTYCCTPKLQTIPEGDWYCTDCIVMAAGGDNCCVCGGSAARKMAKCEHCPRNYHLHCLEPPLSKQPRASWCCPNCKRKKTKAKPRKRERKLSDERPSPVPFAVQEEVRHHVNRKQSSKDMAPCRAILAEMEKHNDAWPFLVPVNPKQIPEYYQIIREPMDFHTMKIKLRDFQYTSRAEFADDARLVFRNCEEFNEDDSEVGVAGKRLSRFFEQRWSELNTSGNSTT